MPLNWTKLSEKSRPTAGWKMSYQMSYRLTIGPPKPQAELVQDEGLTDQLLVTSILGPPGGPGGLSMATFQLGPEGGASSIDPLLAFHVAVTLLDHAISGETYSAAVAAQALALIRRLVKTQQSTEPRV